MAILSAKEQTNIVDISTCNTLVSARTHLSKYT